MSQHNIQWRIKYFNHPGVKSDLSTTGRIEMKLYKVQDKQQSTRCHKGVAVADWTGLSMRMHSGTPKIVNGKRNAYWTSSCCSLIPHANTPLPFRYVPAVISQTLLDFEVWWASALRSRCSANLGTSKRSNEDCSQFKENVLTFQVGWDRDRRHRWPRGLHGELACLPMPFLSWFVLRLHVLACFGTFGIWNHTW